MNSSKKTNTLTSHSPEGSNQRADKMSGDLTTSNRILKGYSKKFLKKLRNKKRRQLLTQNKENKI